MEEKHLKPYLHYSDLYDRFTVEECRHIEKLNSEIKWPKVKNEKVPNKKKARMKIVLSNVHLYFVKGERYIKKAETIQKWMKKDEEHDHFFEKAEAPENIVCLICGKLMFVSSKHLNTGFDKEPDRVLFFYDCPLKHLPRRAFYDNGEEFRTKAQQCFKCQSDVLEEHKKKESNITITRTCKTCGHVEVEEMNFSTKKEAIDLDFAKDRDRFCLSEKEGEEYIDSKRSTENLAKFSDEIKEKEKNKDLYDEVEKIKKLKIIEIEERLSPILEKEHYIKFRLKDPEIGKDVIVAFSVHDAKTNRSDRESSLNLEKVIKKNLQNTNWRLMKGGASYRLGMLEGRLKAYEGEENLIKLLK